MPTFYFDKEFQKYSEDNELNKLMFFVSKGKKWATYKLRMEAGYDWLDEGMFDHGEPPVGREYPKINLWNDDGSIMTEEQREEEAIINNIF